MLLRHHISAASQADKSVSRGFTLVEVLVVLSILGVIAGLAAPAFNTYINRMRVATVSDELMASVQLVRAEAIQRNGMVRMIKITGSDCPSMLSSEFWNCGWRVFSDVNDNSKIDADEDVIREFRITTGVSVVYSKNSTSFVANRWGQVSGINAFSFKVQPSGGTGGVANTNMVCVNSGGRVRLIAGSATCP